MPLKDNAEKVKRFALVPVCRPPHSGNGWHAHVVFVEQDLQPEAMMLRSRKQVIINFKARFLFDPSICAAKVRQKIEFRIRAGFQSGTHINNMHRRNNCGNLTVRLDNFRYPLRVFTLQRRHQM